MKILAIDTSCDETAVAVTEGRCVLSNVIYSQVLIHKKWGGVVPSLAKRAHEERIDFVISQALKKINNFDYVAVTYGPGLAIALEVGIRKAVELSKKYNKKLIAVNHMEGHIYSPLVQNSASKPDIDFKFPYLGLLISGGHTELILWKDHLKYEILGETIDDAAGEALDKAAKMLGLGYPGGAVLERLAKQVNFEDRYKFPRTMLKVKNLNFSFSGLKTAFNYFLKKMSEEEKIKNLNFLVSSYQEAVFDSIFRKLKKAIAETGVNRLVVGGGVAANQYLRHRLRLIMKEFNGEVLFPSYKYLCTDNAAMIGVAAHYHAQAGNFVKNPDSLDRIPRLKLV